MAKRFPSLPRLPREGTDRFHLGSSDAGFALESFWRWANSDLVVNTNRGLLAEYLVSRALGEREPVRDAWRPYDVLSSDGISVEVKSASYFQAWAQDRHTDISFQISPTRSWDPDTGRFGEEKKRQARVYVFCLLAHRVRETLDPMDLSHWVFYAVPTALLDDRCGSQDSITLARLEGFGAKGVDWKDLPGAVCAAAASGSG